MTVYLTMPMTDQRITHQWRTSIQETIEGGEKQSALFTWPRIGLENKIQMVGSAEQGFFQAHLWRDIYTLWGIPIISDKTTLSAQAAAAQKILTITETDYRHFYDGRALILIDPDDWESYEVVIIDTVDSGTQITALVNLTSTWDSGTLIYPLYDCRITDKQKVDSKFKTITSINMMAEESFETLRTFSYSLPTIDTGVFPVYNSLNLFLPCPRAPISNEYRFPYESFGNLGFMQPWSTYDHTRIIFDRDFQFTSKKDIYDILDFFDAKQGRYGTFYTPTWLNDFIISTGFGSGDTTLPIEKTFFTALELTGRHIYVQFPDGSYVCREITGRPTETSITIDSAIGTTVATADIDLVKISFLYEVRFNQDEIALEYQQKKQDIAKIKLAFNTL